MTPPLRLAARIMKTLERNFEKTRYIGCCATVSFTFCTFALVKICAVLASRFRLTTVAVQLNRTNLKCFLKHVDILGEEPARSRYTQARARGFLPSSHVTNICKISGKCRSALVSTRVC